MTKLAPIERAFLDVDQIAEDLIRLIGHDPRYADEAKSALKRIMKIKKVLLAQEGRP
jgi:hypothetical protein